MLTGRDGESGSHWAVFVDLALATLLVFMLAALTQFDRVFVLQLIESRQKEVARLLEDSLPPRFRESVRVETTDTQHQRVTFSSDALFPECKVRLTPRGDSIVRQVGRILAKRQPFFESIQIEGHTDVRPPKGPPSCPVEDNWELSSQRATEVVRLLSIEGLLASDLLSSIGRGQYRPDGAVEDFDRNRRIEFVLRFRERDLLVEAAVR